MGYYVDYHGTVSFPSEKENEIVEALRQLNHKHELKSGRRSPESGDPYEDTWFAWLPSRWHEEEEYSTVESILEMLGFYTVLEQTGDETVYEVSYDGDETVYEVSYDNKMGDERFFLSVLAENGAYIDIKARGEDGEQWAYKTSNYGEDKPFLGHYEAETTYVYTGPVFEYA